MQAKQYLKSHAKAAVLALALPLALSSCSKQQDAAPAPQAVNANTAVQVLNGRVVFADQQAFDQTLASLEKMAGQGDNARAFDAWEQGLNFASLRKAADREEAHLEALETSGAPTPAHALMAAFGFPTAYAAFLNPAGEYQVGQKVYWFHEGFRYEAASVAELVAIKQAPAAAKIKTVAGAHIVESGTVENGVLTPAKGGGNGLATTNTTVASAPYADGRYVYPFNVLNDPGSKRRTIYDIQVFTADNGPTDDGIYYRKFTTNISLQIKYEYYSEGKRGWYRAEGNTFVFSVATNFSGTPSTPQQVNPNVSPVQNTSQNISSSYNGGYAAITLGSAVLYSNIGTQNYTASQVKWTFDLYGRISGYDSRDTAHTYTIGMLGAGPGYGNPLY